MKILITILFAALCLFACSGRKNSSVSSAATNSKGTMAQPQADTARTGEMRVGNIKDSFPF